MVIVVVMIVVVVALVVAIVVVVGAVLEKRQERASLGRARPWGVDADATQAVQPALPLRRPIAGSERAAADLLHHDLQEATASRSLLQLPADSRAVTQAACALFNLAAKPPREASGCPRRLEGRGPPSSDVGRLSTSPVTPGPPLKDSDDQLGFPGEGPNGLAGGYV